jgi:TolA-binding protein
MVSDMLVIVKSREVQRAMLAEMHGDRKEAAKHFLAAAHLELVLADDYAQAGQPELALRSGISAASCFWSAGEADRARRLFDELLRAYPGHADAVRQAVEELEKEYPARC